MKNGSFNNFGGIQRSRKPAVYRDGRAPRTPWCVQCGLERRASVSIGVDEDDQPACQQHVAKVLTVSNLPAETEPCEQLLG